MKNSISLHITHWYLPFLPPTLKQQLLGFRSLTSSFHTPKKNLSFFFFYNLSWIPTIWTVPGDFWALAFLKGGEKKILLTALLWNSSRIIWDPADNPLVIDLWILTQSLRIICCKPICCVKDVSSSWRFRTSSRSLDRGSSFGGEVLL